MATTPRYEAVLGRPPRPKAHKPSRAAWSTAYSPYATGVRASPRSAKHVQHESVRQRDQIPARPKRPLSATQVASTASSRMAQTSPRPSSARSARPTSANQSRYMELETIAFPMQPSAQLAPSVCEACISPPPTTASPTEVSFGALQETDSTALDMKFQALLKVWEEEQTNFRSPALFWESTFSQAKALVSKMPQPNAFLSAISFACLTQTVSVFEDQYPFLGQVIDELRAAVYSNFDELQRQAKPRTHDKTQSALYFELGKPWFQEFVGEKIHSQTTQADVNASKNEIKLLKEMLQEARTAKSTAVAAATFARGIPAQREKLEPYYIPPVLQLQDLSLDSLSEEILKAFSSRSNTDARHILSLLLENAVERDMLKLSDTLAATVGNMKGQDRRVFLRECFDYVTPCELQDALHERDEANDDKRHQILVDDLHELLRMQGDCEPKEEISPKMELFLSEEARIAKRVHELINLVEELSVEVSFFDPKHASLLPETLRQRLRKYECPIKRLKKEHEVLRRQSQDKFDAENPQCECTCGRHRLIDTDDDDGDNDDNDDPKDDQTVSKVPVENNDPQEIEAKTPQPRRRSTLNRPVSAPSNRRKNAISFGSRFGSPRKSSASLHVFPLAEVCHLVSAILHLQFARDAAEPVANSTNDGLSVLTFHEHWAFLKHDPARTFKTLVKDYLVRKYGIKSIAVMHAMQLERSLLHYSVQENNVRCELFGWFFGADKSREQSKDFAFAFFQKLVNCILSLIAAKKTVAPRRNSISSPVPSKIQTLPYSALISMWTECIGDGEPSNHRTLPPSLALEACKLSFSPAMQQHSHFTMFRENLYRQGLGHKTIDLEDFFRGAMTAWQLTFDTQLQEVSKTVESAGVLDIDGFARCLSMNKLDFTTGERYELFDMLTQEDDTSVIPSKTMAHFIMEAKYLRPIPPSTLLNTN